MCSGPYLEGEAGLLKACRPMKATVGFSCRLSFRASPGSVGARAEGSATR